MCLIGGQMLDNGCDVDAMLRKRCALALQAIAKTADQWKNKIRNECAGKLLRKTDRDVRPIRPKRSTRKAQANYS